MAKNSSNQKRKQRSRPPAPSASPRTYGPGVQALDPGTEKEINSLFFRLLKRLGITVIVMMCSSFAVITLARTTHNMAVGVFFCSVLIGLLISFWRNVERVFTGVKALGIERQKQRRYADAVYVLEHFNRLGNMSFDKDGEAHYYLALAYLGLNQPERAEKMAAWLQRNRPRGPYAARAVDSVTRYNAANFKSS